MEKIIKNCKGVKKCNDDINRMQKEKEREDFRIISRIKMTYMKEKNTQFLKK